MSPVIIPIHAQPATTGPGCGDCLHSAAGPVCRSDLGELADRPELSGPADQLQQVLAALDASLALQTGGGLMGSGLVRALHLRDGEADLTLAVAPRCGGALLADTAFQTLRRLLPDTDIYVHHAG